jgi:hypothetical protein
MTPLNLSALWFVKSCIPDGDNVSDEHIASFYMVGEKKPEESCSNL